MTVETFFRDRIREAIAGAIADRKQELTDIAVAGGKAVPGNSFGNVGSLVRILEDIALTAVLTSLGPVGAAGVMKTVEDAAGKEGVGFGFGYLLGYSAYQALAPVLLPLSHEVAMLAQTEIFDPTTAAQLESRGIVDNVYGRNEASGGNLSGEHYDKLVDMARQRPEVAQLLDLWNKGEIAETDVDSALTRHGFHPFWHAPIKSLHRLFLSPADLALAFLRTEIDGAEMRDYSRRLGVTDADMDTLIGNTGEPLGVMELLEAYRRGYIDQPRLERGIRQSRVRNEWIDVAEKLRYTPMSTSDAVRAVVENYLTDEEGAAIAQQNGLLPEHWTPLREAFGRPMSHEQMMTLYHRGEATLDEVRQAFRESDLKNKYIDQAIELGRELIPQRTIVSMIDHGVISHDKGVELLLLHGYTREDADSLVRLGAAQRVSTHKTLTKTELVTMYTDRLLTRNTARDHLMALGYSDSDATAMLDLADVKVKATAMRTLQTGLKATLRAHHITPQDAMNRLEHNGMDTAQARELVDLWTQERSTPTRNLTEAQIVKATDLKLFTVDEGLARLQAIGLAQGDAVIVFQLHGLIPGVPSLTAPTGGAPIGPPAP